MAQINKQLLVSSENISQIDDLFFLYITEPGNGELDIDDFYALLTEESVDRKLFLDKYTTYEFKAIGNSIVLILKLK